MKLFTQKSNTKHKSVTPIFHCGVFEKSYENLFIFWNEELIPQNTSCLLYIVGWNAEHRVTAEQKQLVEPHRPSVSPVDDVYTPVWSRSENLGMYEKVRWLGAYAAICPNLSHSDTAEKEFPASQTQRAEPHTQP